MKNKAKHRVTTCIALYLAAVSSPAQAQDQTVENAQLFLTQILPGQQYRASLDNGGYNPRPGVIQSVQTVGRCDTRLTVHYPYYENSSTYYDAQTLTWSERNVSFLAEVKQRGATIEIFWTFQPWSSRFELSSEQMATRVAFALEFLRINCDRAAATGF